MRVGGREKHTKELMRGRKEMSEVLMFKRNWNRIRGGGSDGQSQSRH